MARKLDKNRIVRLAAAVRTEAQKVFEAADKLSGAASASRETIEKHVDDLIKVAAEAADDVEDRVQAMEDELGRETGGGISDFFDDVGRAMVRAQRRLDVASHQYIRDTVDKSDLIPSTYLIPSVTAKLKIALEKKTSRRIRALVYGKDQNQSQLNQQNIEFELKAVPPPQEAVREIRKGMPKLWLVTDEAVRGELHQLVARTRPSMSALAGLEESWPRALVFQTPDVDERRYFLIMLVTEDEGDPSRVRPEIWFVKPDDVVDAPRDRFIKEAGLGVRAKEKSPFSVRVFEMGQAQASLLRPEEG